MTRLEEVLTKLKVEKDTGIMVNPGQAMLQMMGAINEDVRFLFNECHNLNVALAKTLRELQRVKNEQ